MRNLSLMLCILITCKIAFSQQALMCHGAKSGSLVSKKMFDSFEEISQEVIEDLRETQLAELRAKPEAFCQKNMLMRYLNSKPNFPAPESCSTMSIEQLEEQADLLAQKSRDYIGGWVGSLVPTKLSQERAITTNFLDESQLSLKEFVENKLQYLRNDANLEKVSESHVVERIRKIEGQTIDSFKGLTESIGPTAVCASMSLLNARQCSKGVEFIMKEMMPKRGIGQMTGLFAWKRLADKSLFQGIRAAGIKISERMKKPLEPNVNLFDDIKNSFVASGLSQEKSIDATFDVLMVISNGGSNTQQRAVDIFGNNSISISLGLLGSSMAYLDYSRSKAGLPVYSAPKNVKAGCLYQKPYHFWMAAGLSRHMVKNLGLTPEGAAYASFASNKGYAINRDLVGGGNKGLNTIFNKVPFDPVHQVMRMDFTFAAAGAVFGANFDSQNPKKLDVDKGLEVIIKDATPLRSRRSGESKLLETAIKYREWNAIFSPDSAIKEFLSQAK